MKNTKDTMIIVLQYKNKSFIKIESYYQSQYRINDKPCNQCRGHRSYCWVDGPVTTIKSIIPATNILTHYSLKKEWESLPEDKFPRILDKGYDFTYNQEDDEAEVDLSPFYECQYELGKESFTEQEFEVLHVDGEPQELPSYVSVKFPASLTEFPELQHLYPCRINYSQVYNIVHDAIELHVKQNNEFFRIDNFKNIQTLKVERKIYIPETLQKPQTVEYYPSFHSKKTKKKTVTYTEKWIPVLKLVGTYKNNNDHEQVPSIEGKNYKECKQNLDNLVEHYISRLNPNKTCVCENCSGTGMITID